MYTEHRNHFFTLLFITVALVQCKAVFIKLLTTVNNLLTVVNSGRSMVNLTLTPSCPDHIDPGVIEDVTQKSVYIAHVNGNHFEVVTSQLPQ